jgi:hypothetical protein
MEDKEKELIESFIDYFGPKKILTVMDTDDIIDNIDVDDILKHVDDDDLIEAMDYVSNALEAINDEEIIDYLQDNGYTVYEEGEDPSENSIMDNIEEICREIKPSGYIDKEDAKRLICDYLDTWMIKSI